MSNLLSVRNIVKTYAKHVALNNVSLEVPEKSIFGLLGPNGAGKTSLIRIINQISGPDQGQIFINGEPLKSEHTAIIGYLPEERGLYRKMKVGEQCIYLARLKGLKKKDAEVKLKAWFEKFEMGGWWNKKIEELSKGMQQKVQFIVTVLHEPKLLILDEPFSGFDPINANMIKNEILELRSKGATVIFSTHNMGSVEELCDNIALIHKSEKILDGSVRDIRKQFRTNEFTVGFRGNMIGFTNALWTGAELIDHRSEDKDTHFAKIKIRQQTNRNALLEALLPVAEIISFNEVIPSMNDIFIQSVQKTAGVTGTKSNYTE
jgi:ABC-2 type transport system ATP-binding protein